MFSYPYFRCDALSGFIGLGVAFFSALTLIYSWGFMKGKKRLAAYYAYVVLTALVSLAAALANNLVLLLVMWGFLALLLYLLIDMGGDKSADAAKKSLVIVGGTDALMLLGAVFLYQASGTMQMDQIRLRISAQEPIALIAYLCIAAACFAKAGVVPFHSWIPDACKEAPTPVAAFLPASLDKLLGIYLLARISLDLFVLTGALNMFLMIIGAVTILAAVMMALIQHNVKKLLGFHAVSQVGYMVLGIGTASPIGIAGGLFHMLNNTIYKTCLFMTSGNVEQATGTSELDKLGGLSKSMPITYISCLIASLSISGLPPFNGFVSKWMIYQGILDQSMKGRTPAVTAVMMFCLAAALFASGLTLASFIKLLHSVFLGQKISPRPHPVKEAPVTMWAPCLLLAALCVVFGVFANQLPLKFFIDPVVGTINYVSIWYTRLALLLVAAGLSIGFLVFELGWPKTGAVRKDGPYVGGESIDFEASPVVATQFYNTVRDYGILKRFYNMAEKGAFDIYEQGKKIFAISGVLRYLHNGVLSTYLVWVLLGVAAILIFLR